MLCGTAAGRCWTFGVGGAHAAIEKTTPATNTPMIPVLLGITRPPHPLGSCRLYDGSCRYARTSSYAHVNKRNRHANILCMVKRHESDRIARRRINGTATLRRFSAVRIPEAGANVHSRAWITTQRPACRVILADDGNEQDIRLAPFPFKEGTCKS